MTDIESLSLAKRALLERALRERRAAASAQTTIPRRREGGPAPLSSGQQRMWFLQQWERDAPTFNGARALRLRGALDAAALERSLREIVRRHETLRTVVADGPEPRQMLLDGWSFAMPVIEPEASVGDREAAVRRQLRELAREPFDLTRDLMLRATLIALAPDEHVLLLRLHHIAADAHSDRVLFTELSELYAADRERRSPRLPELPIQYADFAVWQLARLQGARLQDLSEYWGRQLDGAPPLLRLPTDRPRRAVQRHEGSHHELALGRGLGDELVAIGRDQGATFFMVMLAAFSTLLYRWSGEEDIVIGSPIANRNNVEVAGLIGFFTNTMALRTRLGASPSFREVIARARATALGAYAHQDLPFEKVVEVVRPKRDPSYNPLFQVNFRAQGSERPALELAGLEIEPISVDIGFSRFDLALELELRADALAGYVEFDRDLFDLETIVGLEQDLRALLTQVTADPDLPILAIELPHGRRSAHTPAATKRIGRRSAR